jgi:2-polyprenyl-3-methyl-5-hydroxy-6-metoxy-1,4-benzoquinol methylase
MNFHIQNLLQAYDFDKKNSIYYNKFLDNSQAKEIKLRTKVAKKNYDDHLKEISNFHSINVMDKEILNIINKLPKNSLICDIGCGWSWHWRKISKKRPDIKIFLIDMVYENLIFSRKLLKKQINKNIFLIQDNILDNKIQKKFFDFVWSVQVLQHIPDYKKAVQNIYDILKKKGIFYNYNLNTNFVEYIYKLFRKKYHKNGYSDLFYFERSNLRQKEIMKKIFKNKILTRYTEFLFHPDLKITFSGKVNSLTGKLDSLLSNNLKISKFFARQECFIAYKK